jgi:glycosyltransferase involved in cell wall biosynthesis
MRCLWISWMDPRPGMSGELIYSRDLIQAVAAAGVSVQVICLANGESGPLVAADTSPSWTLVEGRPRRAVMSLLSPLPNISYRSAGPAMRRTLDRMLAQDWDCIVLDGIFAGWALAPLQRRLRQEPASRRPRLVYVAHNHEKTLRAKVAGNFRGLAPKQVALRYDAWKAGLLEDRLVQAADLVSAITEEDAARFRQDHPYREAIVLSPGYDGPRRLDRTITADTPRRAVIVGSFDWIAKRMNLREFLSVADPMFASQQAELVVVGRGSDQWAGDEAGQLRATRLVGQVEHTQPYLEEARLALVPERTGGGFKLKVLEYVFNGLPVVGFEDSAAGTPLVPGESIETYDSHTGVATGALALLDDLPRLNRIRERAMAACASRFDWSSRGRGLVEAVKAL